MFLARYCVPDSLALVMRYWGKDVSAGAIGRRITGLGKGTIVVDQRWFAEQQGLRHDFLPLAGIEDIRRCIDAGLPVLVYVPAHVFAIVGYDDVLETFVTYDVATRDIRQEYLQNDFLITTSTTSCTFWTRRIILFQSLIWRKRPATKASFSFP